jgi:hypothetical protein
MTEDKRGLTREETERKFAHLSPRAAWRRVLANDPAWREGIRGALLGDFGELVGQGVDDPIILGSNGLRVGLVIDRVQQGAHPGPR